MSFRNMVLDAAFHGNPFLEQEEKEAFENGRNLAYLIVAIHAVALLKDQGMSELAAHTLDIKLHRFNDVFHQVNRSKAMDLMPSEHDFKISEDGYTRAMEVFKVVLNADLRDSSG